MVAGTGGSPHRGPAAGIRFVAQEYATVRPAAIRINYGLQRIWRRMAVRTFAFLPALVGAWRELGGGIQPSTSGFFRHLDRTGSIGPTAGRNFPRTPNMNGWAMR